MPTSGLVRARPPARRLDEVAGHVGAHLLSPAPLTAAAPAAERAERAGPADPATLTGPVITGISLDSRAIQPGDLYAALPGAKTHGGRFAQDAAARGAAAILTDPDGAEFARAAGLPVLVVPQPRQHLGELAAWLFGEPAQQLTMFGVTGTNGKTTTTFLLDGALRRGGQVTGMIGTIQTRIGDEVRDSVRTTPEAPDVQSLLAAMVEQGASACSMEVSSHALALGRVDGIVFDVAGFTNLSQDHLDFHPTMEDYFATKTDLFTRARARQGVICVDDAWGRRLAEQAEIPVITLNTIEGSVTSGADWIVTGCAPDGGGTTFTLTGPGGRGVQARCPLPGGFNVANTALAVVMLVQSGVSVADAVAWLAGADTVPGRMQPVTSAGDGSGFDGSGFDGSGFDGEPLAVVDYAHTPDAVAAAALALRDRGVPLVLVLGAGGDRDRQKRPRMGEAAASVADVVIVTDDNPRSEDPAAIRAAVLSGAQAAPAELRRPNSTVLEIPGRTAAIAEAVRLAWGGGTVLLAGKGHERGQEIAGVVHPFDDREVLAAALMSEGMKRTAPAGAMNTVQDGRDGTSRSTSVPNLEGPDRMIELSLAEIASATSGTLSDDATAQARVTGAVRIDSRPVQPGDLFVALAGDHVDGHAYAAAALAAGAVAVIAERPIDGPAVIVDDAVHALGQLARVVRERLPQLRVTGVTGSSGKTSTKDLLAAVVAAAGPSHAPPGSLNNELGVPLTILQADGSTRFLVLEMGSRGIGHIEYLCRIAQPDVGIVLNVGAAHAGEFGGREQTALAKGELVEGLRPSGLAVLNADDPLVAAMAGRTQARVVLTSVGSAGAPPASSATVTATDVVTDEQARPSFRLHTPAGDADVRLRVHGVHQVANALAAAAAGLEAGLTPEQIADALGSAGAASRWRMEVTRRGDGLTVVNDAYNANPDSMIAALRALASMRLAGGGHPGARRIAVLGEMLELGDEADAGHEQVGRLAGTLGIDVIAIGPGAAGIIRGAASVDGAKPASVASWEDAVEVLERSTGPGDLVLVKASRGIGLERVADALLKMGTAKAGTAKVASVQVGTVNSA